MAFSLSPPVEPLIDDTQWGAVGGNLVPTCLIFQLNATARSPSLDLLRLTFYCTAPTHVIPAVKVDRMFIDYYTSGLKMVNYYL